MFRIKVMGIPEVKQRPRFTRSGHTYTPPKTKEYENHVIGTFIESYPNSRPIQGEAVAIIKAYFPIPKSTSKIKRMNMIQNIVRPITSKDIDNICKAILDGLNGYAYIDDRQVVMLIAEKLYAETPRVEVFIYERPATT